MSLPEAVSSQAVSRLIMALALSCSLSIGRAESQSTPEDAQTSRTGPFSKIAGGNTPTGWTQMVEYPEPCQKAMNQVDSIFKTNRVQFANTLKMNQEGLVASVEKYLLPPPNDGSPQRSSIWFMNMIGIRTVLIFEWDIGGTTCSTDMIDRSNAPEKLE